MGRAEELEESFAFFCDNFGISKAKAQEMKAHWFKILLPYGRSANLALRMVSLEDRPFVPKVGTIVQRAERIFCPPVEDVWVWEQVMAAVRKSGPLPEDLHQAVRGAINYVGIDRLSDTAQGNISSLKREVEHYVAFYNAQSFAKRAVLEGRATAKAISTLPTSLLSTSLAE